MKCALGYPSSLTHKRSCYHPHWDDGARVFFIVVLQTLFVLLFHQQQPNNDVFVITVGRFSPIAPSLTDIRGASVLFHLCLLCPTSGAYDFPIYGRREKQAHAAQSASRGTADDQECSPAGQAPTSSASSEEAAGCVQPGRRCPFAAGS